jgi:hypothetical protein
MNGDGGRVWIFPTAAAMFLVLAVLGGFVAPYRMNKPVNTRVVAVGYGTQTSPIQALAH